MKLLLTITKDTVTGDAVNTPQVARNTADAKRIWGNAISQLSKDPTTNVPYKDMQLYSIGTFDTETFEIEPGVEFLCSAQEFIK